MIERELALGHNVGRIVCPVPSAIAGRAWVSVSCDGGGRAQVWFQRAADPSRGENVDKAPPGAGKAWTNPDGSGFTFGHATRPGTQLPAGTEFIQYVVDSNGAGSLLVEFEAK